jgi:hypothetical protein
MVQIHSPRPFITPESNTYSHLQTGSDLIVCPFGPITALFDGGSKPKPILSAASLQNTTSCRILSYGSEIARRPSIPALSEWNGDAAEGQGTLRNLGRNNNSPGTSYRLFGMLPFRERILTCLRRAAFPGKCADSRSSPPRDSDARSVENLFYW